MAGPGKSWWYWMPSAVFLIGTASIALLLWSERLGQKQRTDFLLADALMDVQMHLATFHLRMEEYMDGKTTLDMSSVWRELEASDRLIDAMLVGKEGEQGAVLGPLRDESLRARAGHIRYLIAGFRKTAEERLRAGAGIGTEIEERFDRDFTATQANIYQMESVLEAENNRSDAKSKRLFHGILLSWVVMIVIAVAGIWNRERGRRIARLELMEANKELLQHREGLFQLIKERTAELTEANENLKENDRRIRHLSEELLSAQEIERKRIAMELHDGLGQALNVMKLRLRVIEKGLGEDQSMAREECEELLSYINQVIEEVRRMSLALSPTVLEELGLTSSLKWLLSSLSGGGQVNVTHNIENIDSLLPRSRWITLYRIMQEAITNISRHSGASNVSVAIHRIDSDVSFSIEDDGKGFDPDHHPGQGEVTDGRGLTTMSERVEMLGGVFRLSSRRGEGTKISFIIPSGEGGD